MAQPQRTAALSLLLELLLECLFPWNLSSWPWPPKGYAGGGAPAGQTFGEAQPGGASVFKGKQTAWHCKAEQLGGGVYASLLLSVFVFPALPTQVILLISFIFW